MMITVMAAAEDGADRQWRIDDGKKAVRAHFLESAKLSLFRPSVAACRLQTVSLRLDRDPRWGRDPLVFSFRPQFITPLAVRLFLLSCFFTGTMRRWFIYSSFYGFLGRRVLFSSIYCFHFLGFFNPWIKLWTLYSLYVLK